MRALELGEIRDVLIDPDSCKVKYLLVLDSKWYLGAILLSFEDILSIGTDAVTIEARIFAGDFTRSRMPSGWLKEIESVRPGYLRRKANLLGLSGSLHGPR